MIFAHLDPAVLDDAGEMEFGGPVVGEKERFRVRFLVNDRAGTIAIEDFPAGRETRWAFWHDEVHVVLEGEAEISYTLPPNHGKVVTRTARKGDTYLILNGTRATFRVTSGAPYLHACVIMPRYQLDKWLLREEYGDPAEGDGEGEGGGDVTPEAGLSRNTEEAEAPEWVPRGCRCGACGRVFYPAKRICLTCGRATEMQPVSLSRRGVLYTFTVIHVGLEGFRPPYAVGWIDLPEGVRLFAPLLSGDSETPLRIGTPMEMVLHPLPDERGELTDGFAFQPIEGEA